jgi:cytochrome d ubiquinol oxidase subunit II
VPFALGAAVGGIATDRVPVGNAAGDLWSSWLGVTPVMIGVLAVASSAYLAAVFLAADAAHDGEAALERDFRVRALGSGVVAGALAIAGIFVVGADNHKLFHSLSSGRALPAVIVSGLAGVATLILVYRRRYEPARYSAALAVAAITAGWALSRWPEILPGLSVRQAAAGHDTLVCLVVAVIAGGVILFPSLGLLFSLTLTGRFRSEAAPAPEASAPRHGASVRLLTRLAVASAIAGFGLLTVADAGWAHALGVAFLFTFMLAGFAALTTPSSLGREEGASRS